MSTEDAFSETEDLLIKAVPKALKDGVALLDWWKAKDPGMSYARHYEETKTLNRPEDGSYGFFDSVQLPSSGEDKVAINGNVQEMFYDDPKAPPGDEKLAGVARDLMHHQIREFILKYFMRISDFRQPQPAESEDGGDVTGFGFSQVYYKRRNGKPARFPSEEQDKIVDLRDFEKKSSDGKEPYEWIVLKNPIFGFGFEFEPFGNLVDSLIGVSGPKVKLPADVFNYLVLSRDFVVDEDLTKSRTKKKRNSADDGIIGRYGFGYAFVNDPEPSVYGYGPGQLQPAFEQMVWEVHESGKISVRAAFVAQEPKGILQLSVDPLAWGFQLTKALGGEIPGILKPVKRFWDNLPLTNMTFDPVLPAVGLLNALTFGQAAKLGISKDRLVKDALFIHFLQHYQTIVGSLQTWRQIRDWTAAEADMPAWVVSGKSR